MTGQRVYGILDGSAVGSLPFAMLAVFPAGEQQPGSAALAVSVILAVTAFRTPLAWGLGVAAGAVLSTAVLAIVVGTDWRLLPYVVVGFYGYYLVAASAVVVSHWVWTMRSRLRP